MRSARFLATTMLLLVSATLLLPQAGIADDDDDGRKLTGIVLAVNADGSFEMREFGEDKRWTIILHREADIEVAGLGKIRRVNEGDVVEVEGRRLERRTLLVRKVRVVAHRGGVQSASGQSPAPTGSNTLVSVVKTIGVGAAVKFFSPALNSFINGLLRARDAETKQMTKVVPILSLSIGVNTPGKATVGAAQVSGPQAAVNKVVAVAAVDANFQDGFFVRTLVPVDSLEPWKRLRRVVGVGVSAIIDLRI